MEGRVADNRCEVSGGACSVGQPSANCLDISFNRAEWLSFEFLPELGGRGSRSGRNWFCRLLSPGRQPGSTPTTTSVVEHTFLSRCVAFAQGGPERSHRSVDHVGADLVGLREGLARAVLGACTSRARVGGRLRACAKGVGRRCLPGRPPHRQSCAHAVAFRAKGNRRVAIAVFPIPCWSCAGHRHATLLFETSGGGDGRCSIANQQPSATHRAHRMKSLGPPLPLLPGSCVNFSIRSLRWPKVQAAVGARALRDLRPSTSRSIARGVANAHCLSPCVSCVTSTHMALSALDWCSSCRPEFDTQCLLSLAAKASDAARHRRAMRPTRKWAGGWRASQETPSNAPQHIVSQLVDLACRLPPACCLRIPTLQKTKTRAP